VFKGLKADYDVKYPQKDWPTRTGDEDQGTGRKKQPLLLIIR
jgi:hypothetical protein